MNAPIFSIELTSTKLIDYGILEKFSSNLKFCSLTWHVEPKNFYFTNETNLPVLNLAEVLLSKNYCVLLHIPCQNLTKYEALLILDRAKRIGVKYILAIRGDKRHASKYNAYFYNSIEFVKFIKRYYGNYFSVGVAGYPRGHPLAPNVGEDLEFLKSKVFAGADFILLQFEFDYRIVEQFLHRCKLIQIRIPTIIGVYIISPTSDKIAEKCGIVIPNKILKVLNRIKHNYEAVDNYSLFQAISFIKNILSKKILCQGIHIYSMNKLLKVHCIYKNVIL